jgi:hypothetical protein
MSTERRHFPRMAVKELSYLNLEKGNGGIILNISEGGLCFHSAIPVQPAATVRFWFSEGINRIEAEGRVAWTDETRKRGGLIFTDLPADVREEIHNWISLHALPVTVDEKLAPSLPVPRVSPSWHADLRDSIVAAPGFATAAAPTLQIQLPRVFTGFSGGLLAGILVTSLVTGIFMLETHRHELGASLIRLGERLGGSSMSQTAPPEPETAASEPQPGLPEPNTTLPESRVASPYPKTSWSELQPASPRAQVASETQSPSPALIPVSRQEKFQSSPPVAPVQSQAMKLAAAIPTPAPALPSNANSSSTPATSFSSPPQLAVPAIALAPTSDPSPDIPRAAVPQLQSPNQPGVHIERSQESGTPSPSEKYLEVGRFKDKLWANETNLKLTQFGFQGLIVPRNGFWKKSYQLLVGPYSTDQEAETVHKDLSSHGFDPRSFERGSREFRLPRVLRLGGASMPIGDCTVSWESYLPDAIVKFQISNASDVVAEGKWVDRTVKYPETSVVYVTNRDGSRTLTEIRFSGMKRALVFSNGGN